MIPNDLPGALEILVPVEVTTVAVRTISQCMFGVYILIEQYPCFVNNVTPNITHGLDMARSVVTKTF